MLFFFKALTKPSIKNYMVHCMHGLETIEDGNMVFK